MKFLAAIFYCVIIFEAINAEGNADTNDQDLKVIVSFESFNELSVCFFKDQLAPVYEELSKCVKWHFIPCSTSHIVDEVLQCREGVAECQMDVLHACAAHYYENSEYELGKFFICMMTSDEQFLKGEEWFAKCAKKACLDWEKLKKCKPSLEAGGFCNNRYNQLNTLHVVHVPGIFFNWRYNKQVDEHAFKDLKSVVCDRLQKIGKSCAACPTSCGGGSGGGAGGGSGGNSG